MIDINKYLQSQEALAQKKKLAKPVSTHSKVSEKSLKTAERISKKQKKHSNDRNTQSDAPSTSSGQRTSSKPLESDSEEEYLPSEDESEPDSFITNVASRAGQKRHLTKVIDDGDQTCYFNRTQTWKQNLKEALSGNHSSETPNTADVVYVLQGNTDPDGNHELSSGLLVPNYIWKQLYKFQRTGIKWLFELHKIKSGGLLGDEMGLGKTVQLIAYFAGLAKTKVGSWDGLGPSVIIAPATVIYQWVSHFHHWCPYLRVAVLHNSGSHAGSHNKLIRDIHGSHGVLLLTYAGMVRYSGDILSRKWHYVVLDEGHKIRNPDTQVSKVVKKFTTPHRILITGSPMQNSLQELWSLFDFMSPGLLGSQSAFTEYFALPITQGGYANATQLQEVTALEIAKSLKKIITPYMIRRTKAEVQEYIKLPEKNEQVLFCSLNQEQKDLYMGYLMSGTVRSILDKESRYGDPLRARILVALITLRKICNHPDLYLYEAQDGDTQVNEESFGYWKRCGKMTVVHSLLKIWQKQGHRALIFSQSRAMLCILEHYLQQNDYQYLKMDGTVSVASRQNIIKTFNENSEYLVFLATTRVGGLGVNLTGADRVVIYDPDWNPATDSQAKERAWRIGQQRNVTVYRLLSAGTIEEKIYQRQVFKSMLSNKVLVDPNQKNLLKTSTLQGLFTLEDLNKDGDTETASIFSHTKVDVRHQNNKKDSYKNGVSFTQAKIEAMRKKAREISKMISDKKKQQNPEILINPRERYKQKRDTLLNPPTVEEPEINLVDDSVTDAPFEAVLSELDIVNLHSKQNYVQELIENTLRKNKAESAVEDQSNIENDVLEVDDKLIKECQQQLEVPEEMNCIDETEGTNIKSINSDDTIKSSDDEKLKLVKEHSEDETIENLVAVKKLKKKKRKREKERKESKEDDDYVLSKLFAKSGVRNALQHDAVVGLAEREQRLRVQQEATTKARHALRALRKSARQTLHDS